MVLEVFSIQEWTIPHLTYLNGLGPLKNLRVMCVWLRAPGHSALLSTNQGLELWHAWGHRNSRRCTRYHLWRFVTRLSCGSSTDHQIQPPPLTNLRTLYMQVCSPDYWALPPTLSPLYLFKSTHLASIHPLRSFRPFRDLPKHQGSVHRNHSCWASLKTSLF